MTIPYEDGAPPEDRFARFVGLERFVGWTAADAARVRQAGAAVADRLAGVVDDFYDAISTNPVTRRVLGEDPDRVARLKGTLQGWLAELLSGPYDRAYVDRRWRVGARHVEIGLDQVFTNAALSRARRGVVRAFDQAWAGGAAEAAAVRESVHVRFDLDLAIIEDAYQSEHLARQQRVERMATIGQVGGGIAHELRNPLNVIKTSVYYLLNTRTPSAEKAAEHLRRIERQIGLADGVITALSNFARMPAPDRRPFDLPGCVAEVLADGPPPAGVEVVQGWAPALPPVLADRGQLKIVLANLLRNAFDAMPRGGRLRLDGGADDGWVRLAVADTGVGVPADLLGRISEPLYTTKARGLGLGLALARSLVEKNGGAMAVASVVGGGTTFTLRLAPAGERSAP